MTRPQHPVNALVVGNTEPMHWCMNHEGWVPLSRLVSLHGGRGYDASTTCLDCMKVSCEAWAAENCEFCSMTALRIGSAIAEYERTGEPLELAEVPGEELPPHRKGCRFEHSTVEGQPKP